jgi:N-acyl-L-homoserine lactone synthetase
MGPVAVGGRQPRVGEAVRSSAIDSTRCALSTSVRYSKSRTGDYTVIIVWSSVQFGNRTDAPTLMTAPAARLTRRMSASMRITTHSATTQEIDQANPGNAAIWRSPDRPGIYF